MLVLVAQLLAGGDTLSARAESLLAQGKLPEARRIAEQLVARDPRDSQAHLLLGRVWMRWPTFGRYNAYEEFRTAGSLAPQDPEPLYWKARVGMYLKSDEGEIIAREAILRLFAIRTDYRNAWTVFESVYHDKGIWRRADEALARHPDDPLALERRAAIAIALEEPARADSLAALAVARGGPSVRRYLLRAEAACDAGHDSLGSAWYDSALARAAGDSADAIWDQLWMIATPIEAAGYDSLRPEERQAFFAAFWSRRDPNLVTPLNERLGEHFRRFATVRRMFHLLHPWLAFQHSRYARALAQSYLDDSVQRLLDSPGPGDAIQRLLHSDALDRLDPATSAMPDLSAWNETKDTLTTYALTNLSACGLMWLRHGRPDVWEAPESASVACTGTWTYYTAAGPLTVRFMGVPGPYGGHGDAIIAPPTTAHAARQTRMLLTTDDTKIPAPLVAHAWSAMFVSDQIGFTDVYFKAVPETAAVVLWDTTSGEAVGRAASPGLLAVSVAPGAYRLGLDVDSAGVLGRARENLRVPAFSDAVLALSSLVLVPGDSVGDREEMLAAMPADLVYPTGRPLAAYAEIYGLHADASGRARYRVEYTFAPLRALPQRILGGGHEVRLAFTREAPVRGLVPERLVLEAGRLPPGHYRVSIAVTDLATDVKTTAVALDIAVR